MRQRSIGCGTFANAAIRALILIVARHTTSLHARMAKILDRIFGAFNFGPPFAPPFRFFAEEKMWRLVSCPDKSLDCYSRASKRGRQIARGTPEAWAPSHGYAASCVCGPGYRAKPRMDDEAMGIAERAAGMVGG